MNNSQLDAIIDDQWTLSTTELAERGRASSAEVEDLTSLAMSEAPEFDPKTLGLGDLTPEDWAGYEAQSQEPIEFGDTPYKAKHLPGIGVGFELAELAEGQIAALAVGAGKATYEQQKLYMDQLIHSSRERTVGGTFDELLVGTTPIILEGTAAFVGGAGLTAVAARKLAKEGFERAAKVTRSAIVERATQIGLVTGAREGIPQATDAAGISDFGGGAWSANSLRRAIPEMDLTDDEVEHMLAISESGATEALLGKAFETNPLARGFGEELLRNSIEFGVGPAISSLTVGAIKNGLLGAALRRTVTKADDGLAAARKVQAATGQDGPFTEILEENISGVAVEARYGEEWQHGLTDDVYEVAAIAMLGAIPGASGATIAATKRIMDSRRAAARGRIADAKAAELAAQQEATPGASEPGAASETPAGGDTSQAGEAPVSEAGAEPATSTVDPFERFDIPIDSRYDVLDQSLGDRLSKRSAAQRTESPMTLVDYVLAAGGIDLRSSNGMGSEGGDFMERIRGVSGKIGKGMPSGFFHGPASRAQGRGLNPDNMREYLQQAGFIGQSSDGRMEFDELLYAIESELSGGDVMYHPEVAGEIQQAEEMRGRLLDEQRFADEAAEWGVDPDELGKQREEPVSFSDVFGDDPVPAAEETFTPRATVAAFAEAAGLRNASPVKPQTDKQAEAAQVAALLGRKITLVSGEGGGKVNGMIDNQGRMFVHAETADPLGVAVHEMGHDLADTLGPVEFRKELEQIESIAPGIVERYRDRWIRRNEASQAQDLDQGTRAAGEAAASAPDPSADLATEEGFTSLAEEYSALISYASTTQGRADVALIAQHSPTIFRRMIDSVKRVLGKFKADSPLGALDRIEKASRTRPDKAAAQLSLYLADLYKRGFGVQQDAPGGAQGQGGGTLLEQLQAEAEARGVQVVRPQGAAVDSAGLNVPLAAQEATSGPAAAAQTAEPAGQPAGQSAAPTTQAVPVGEPSAASNPDAVPRPDLSNPLKTPENRATLDEADRKRNEAGLPAPQSRKEVRDFADAELQRDYDGTRAEIEAKINTGERLQTWEVHALIEIVDQLATDGLAGNKAALADAMELNNAYREIRAEAGRDLGTVVGRGRSAKDAVLDMILMETRSNRRKRAKIVNEINGIMKLVSPFKSQSAKYLRTRHQMEQERKGNRFAPNRELKFAPGLLDDRGKPITEARLEYLQGQLEKIKVDEAARIQKAGEAVARLGYDLEALDMETLIDPHDGFMIRNAISSAKATGVDKFLELRYMNMLSGLKTHMRNTAGNASMLVLDGPVAKSSEIVANMLLKGVDASGKTTLADPEGAVAGELAHWFRGFANAIPLAFRNMLTAYRTQGPAFEMDLQASGAEMGVYAHDFGSKLDFVPGPKIGPDGVIGRAAHALRTVSLNTLLASDEFFKTLAATAEVHSLAFRQAASEGLKGDARSQRMQELVDDRGSEIWTQALYKAREVTFQDEGGAGAQYASKVLNDIVGGADALGETYLKTPIGSLLIPFRKTPVRIAARALRLTPLQSAMLPVKAIAGDYNGNQAALVRDLADAMMAWGLALTIMNLVDLEDEEGRPFITGARPDNRASSSIAYATAPPMTIQIDGTYYEYGHLEPLATGLGMLVSMAEELKTGGRADTLSALLQSAVAQTKDKTFLRTIGDIMELADSSRRGKDRIAAFVRDTLVTPMVPNIIRQTARESDDVLRDRRKLEDGATAFWLDGIYATSADSLAVKSGADPKQTRYTAWGEPIKRPFARKGGTDTIYRLLSPVVPKLDTKDTSRLDLALLTWERKVTSGEVEEEAVYFPSRPTRTFSIDKVEYTMTPTEFSRYARESGKAAAASIMGDSSINLDDPGKKDIAAIKKAVSASRRAFKAKLTEERRKLSK